MKTIFLVLTVAFLSTKSLAQCPEPTEQSYNKVMNAAFSEDYKTCPTIIKAEFFASGGWKGAMFPKKVKSYVMFQCIDVGSQASIAPRSGESRGELFCMDKANSDIIFSIKKGDKIKLTGTTYTNNYFGMKTVFFIVTKVENM